MSKTIRRKNESWMKWNFAGIYFSSDTQLDFFGYMFNKKYHGCTLDQIKKKKCAKFHSDCYRFNASSKFRKSLEQSYRFKQNQKLRTAIIQDDTENLICDKRLSNANWLYF